MKYYIIAGEASGDLHAAHLMKALKRHDGQAEFRFFGGDNMAAEGGTMVRHYRDLAYMGFVPVLLHLRTIFSNMAFCKRDIEQWQPDVAILVDYPGFNLSIARFLRAKTSIPAYYYISPKIWAWKEWRIRNIKRDVSELFSILPFEVPFYEQRHHYPIHYVGNPTADEVRSFRASYKETTEQFCRRHSISPPPATGTAEGTTPAASKGIIALLAGSRRQEINDNLPSMLAACAPFTDRYNIVIAGAPAIEPQYYDEVIGRHKGVDYDLNAIYGAAARQGGRASAPTVVYDTYALLSHSVAALVTSGTATLETALFGVPQVVCYRTPVPHLIRFAFNHIIRCRYISLVNLIADSEVVSELLADRFTIDNIRQELESILTATPRRQAMLEGYQFVAERLGDTSAPDNAARIIIKCLA